MCRILNFVNILANLFVSLRHLHNVSSGNLASNRDGIKYVVALHKYSIYFLQMTAVRFREEEIYT